ncbi:Hypothetical predicted protein [Mytilus galloprovincialis]|uniref:Uncharacterized protein n=1 Tax=Mytilus galloprovincialis TaxID=29158 RepID=A0A8B6H8Q3_MYTGA|nr:Hypothetical predicted protein [Mytilus galloprovincialis]
MDISRLKSLRAGNKAAVTKVFKKLEEAIGDSQIDRRSVKRVTTDKTRPINTKDKSFNSNRKKQCAYCDGNHWPNECKDVIDHDKRVAIIKEKRLCFNCLVCHKQEECDLEKFWKLESLGIDAKEQNDPDLAESIENYLQTSITKKNNKYITKLPWRENAPELPTNEDIAKRRTESVIRRLKKDPEMFRKYGEIITDQEQRGFIEKGI